MPRPDVRRRCGLSGNLGTGVGLFSMKRLPVFSNGEPRKRSAVHREATRAPEPSKSLPAADPSDELLEGVPEEAENQQKEAGQNSDHSGNGSGTQTGANVGDHFSQVYRLSVLLVTRW